MLATLSREPVLMDVLRLWFSSCSCFCFAAAVVSAREGQALSSATMGAVVALSCSCCCCIRVAVVAQVAPLGRPGACSSIAALDRFMGMAWSGPFLTACVAVAFDKGAAGRDVVAADAELGAGCDGADRVGGLLGAGVASEEEISSLEVLVRGLLSSTFPYSLRHPGHRERQCSLICSKQNKQMRYLDKQTRQHVRLSCQI